MRFKISQELMSGLVTRAQSVIERKSTRPILENILLTCRDGQLTLSATDLRISMIQTAECVVEEEGAVSITGKKIHEIVKEMETGEIVIENRENEWVTITGGKSTFHLPGVSEEEFPTIPEAPESFLNIPSDVFEQMVSRTLFAASNDETRIYLCGVFLKEWKDDKGDAFLKMVATDGHRLSLVDRALETPLNLFTDGIIIPKKGVSELKYIISQGGENFEIACSDGRLFARIDGVMLSITLIDASFPNYNQVVPDFTGQGIMVPCNSIRDALRRVSILSDQETRSVVMEVTGSEMTLSSDNPTFGDAKETLDVDYNGPHIKAAFNSTYVMEIIKVMEDDAMRIEIKDSLSPALFVGCDKDSEFLSVVMPMRID